MAGTYIIVGAARNEEVPQSQIKNHFSTSCHSSRGFPYKLIGDY